MEKYPESIRSQSKAQEKGGSAFVGSLEEARQIVADKNLQFPILVIPQGENVGEDYFVVNSESELDTAVGNALSTAIKGKVHLISRYPEKLQSGSRSSEAHLK